MAAMDASEAWTVSQQMMLILLRFLLTVTGSWHVYRNVTVNQSSEVLFSRLINLRVSYDSKKQINKTVNIFQMSVVSPTQSILGIGLVLKC